jgi:hypothetical protein
MTEILLGKGANETNKQTYSLYLGLKVDKFVLGDEYNGGTGTKML